MKIAKLKSVYNSFIIGPRGLQSEINLYNIGNDGLGIFDVFRFDLGPILQGQTRKAKL